MKAGFLSLLHSQLLSCGREGWSHVSQRTWWVLNNDLGGKNWKSMTSKGRDLYLSVAIWDQLIHDYLFLNSAFTIFPYWNAASLTSSTEIPKYFATSCILADPSWVKNGILDFGRSHPRSCTSFLLRYIARFGFLGNDSLTGRQAFFLSHQWPCLSPKKRYWNFLKIQ